ncbi:hypothetical protein Btru_044589 [Bulinus truncatus]|nr:hypothetical protein Btru_044589 [Bulinus truncatus]
MKWSISIYCSKCSFVFVVLSGLFVSIVLGGLFVSIVLGGLFVSIVLGGLFVSIVLGGLFASIVLVGLFVSIVLVWRMIVNVSYECNRFEILVFFLPQCVSAEHIAENTYQLLRNMYVKYGPVFRLQLGRDTVVLTEPKDVDTVYRHEGRCPLRPNLSLREVYSRRTGTKLRDVSMLQGEEWAAVRTPLNKLLVKVNSASQYLPEQCAVADDFVTCLANEKMTAERLNELFFRFSAESIGVVCFNSRIGLLHNLQDDSSEIAGFLKAAKDNFTMLHRSLTGKSFAHVLYKNETYRQYEDTMTVLNKYSRKFILKARQNLQLMANNNGHNSDRPNLLHNLLSDKALDDDSVSQILESLFIGGTDSTAGSLAALFYNLARNPDKQEKLASEVRRFIGRTGEVTPEILNQMHYLKACLKESFRLHYPVSAVFRVLQTDITVSGYHVPAGVQYFI